MAFEFLLAKGSYKGIEKVINRKCIKGYFIEYKCLSTIWFPLKTHLENALVLSDAQK